MFLKKIKVIKKINTSGVTFNHLRKFLGHHLTLEFIYPRVIKGSIAVLTYKQSMLHKEFMLPLQVVKHRHLIYCFIWIG